MELNYIGTHGSNLLMRRTSRRRCLYDPANPQSVDARKPFPNFGTYIDSDWSGRSNYNALNAKLEHRSAGSILTFAYTWAKSTDTKSAAAGIGASGFNGWQGFLDNHDPERDYGLSDFDVDHRLVGSFVYNLPFGNGEKYRHRRDRREERRGRRLAGERHLYLAARLPADDHGRGSRRPQRHVRHQPRRPGRRSERRRPDGDPMVQHGAPSPSRRPARSARSGATPSEDPA